MRYHTGIQFPGITRTVTTSDGVSLSVREYGSSDAAHTVVLLHGRSLPTVRVGVDRKQTRPARLAHCPADVYRRRRADRGSAAERLMPS